MPLLLPNFDDVTLQYLSACAGVCLEDEDNKAAWPFTEPVRVRAVYSVGEKELGLRLILDNDEDEHHGHFHIDLTTEPEDWDYAESKFQLVALQELLDKVDQLQGFCATTIFVFARYAISRDHLPKRGIISSLLGVSTESCGSEMHLSGATMQIESDLFSSVEWRVLDDTEGDDEPPEIEVKLQAESASEVGDSYLIDLVEIMREGLECFVFENSKEKVDHVEAGRALPEKKSGA